LFAARCTESVTVYVFAHGGSFEKPIDLSAFLPPIMKDGNCFGTLFHERKRDIINNHWTGRMNTLRQKTETRKGGRTA
jgi:hypothetical protein